MDHIQTEQIQNTIVISLDEIKIGVYLIFK